MTTIAILREQSEDQLTEFSAVATGHRASGRTAGEALDALSSQLSAEDTGGPVIVQQFLPDQFFSAAQRDRLSLLMGQWRAARETGNALPQGEQAELERLVDEEVQGAGERAAQIVSELEPTGRLRDGYVEEILARDDRESRLALRRLRGGSGLHNAGVLSSTIGLLLTLLGTVSVLKGAISGGINVLLIGATLEAVSLVLIYFAEREALKRIASRDPNAEENRTHPEPTRAA